MVPCDYRTMGRKGIAAYASAAVGVGATKAACRRSRMRTHSRTPRRACPCSYPSQGACSCSSPSAYPAFPAFPACRSSRPCHSSHSCSACPACPYRSYRPSAYPVHSACSACPCLPFHAHSSHSCPAWVPPYPSRSCRHRLGTWGIPSKGHTLDLVLVLGQLAVADGPDHDPVLVHAREEPHIHSPVALNPDRYRQRLGQN